MWAVKSQTDVDSLIEEGGDVDPDLTLARLLACRRDPPLLALNAYSKWMRKASGTTKYVRATALLDFTLYCNVFALRNWEFGDDSWGSSLEKARDYFRAVTEEYNALYHVGLPSLDATEDDSTWVGVSSRELCLEHLPDGLKAALLVTLGNRACVELRAGKVGLAKAEKLFSLSRQLEETIGDTPCLGWAWRTVRELNAAIGAVMHCDFARSEEAAGAAFAALESHIGQKGVKGESGSSSENTLREEQENLLLALCYYTRAVATENSSCETSLADYDQAIACSPREAAGVPLTDLMAQTRKQLVSFVEEQRAKALLAAEDSLRAATAEKKARGAARPRTGKGAASRRTPQKALNPRHSQPDQVLPPIVAPPIPDVLRHYLAQEGLATSLVRVCPLKSVYQVLVAAIPREGDDGASPSSLFKGTRFEGCAEESLFAVLFCTTTPLQWTLRLLAGAEQPITTRLSVWTPRSVVATLVSQMAEQRPPAPRSEAAQQTRKEIEDGNGKLRQQILQLFAPPAAAAAVKQKTSESVNTVVTLLGQRLGLLLRTERSFEEHWIATERIVSALRAFAVPQDILRLKKTLRVEKRLRERRQDRSARIIVHFFRHVVKQHTLRAEQTRMDRQRFEWKEAAAITLQKYTRRWCAFQEVARRHAARKEYVKKVIILQSLARRNAASRAYHIVRAARCEEYHAGMDAEILSWAALEIQRVYRGHCARLRCYHLRGQDHQITLHHFRSSRHYYATLIQKRVRGMLVRLQYGQAVYARRCYGRNRYKTQLWAHSCVVIQRAYRAYRWRCAALVSRATQPITVRSQDWGARAVTAAAPSGRPLIASAVRSMSPQWAAEEVVAACCIQQMYRSCVAKRRYEALKYARSKEVAAQPLQWSHLSTFVLKDCDF